MKIKKLIESKLIEADEEKVDGGATEVETGDTAELADAVAEHNPELDDNQAEVVADELNDEAEAVGAGKIVITKEDYEGVVVKSDLFFILDAALANARRQIRQKAKGIENDTELNILIEGLPGSGKTAIVSAWCKANDLVLVALNSTDPKLETAINGMPLRDVTKPDANAVAYAYTDKLDYLINEIHPECEGRCILFVDEFNRQTNLTLRRPLMSLFNEKRNADGSTDFRKNLLFSIICNNPTGVKYQDKGTSKLNDAESDRFFDQVKGFDSTPERTLAYFDGWFLQSMLNLGIIPPGSKASKNHDGFVGPTKELSIEDREDAEDVIKKYTLAKYILTHPEFEFTSREELDDLHDQDCRPLTSRSFTSLIKNTDGDKNQVLKKVDTTLNVLPETKEMFHSILDPYVMDTIALFKNYGLDKEDIAAGVGGTKPSTGSTVVTDEPEEDDDDLFVSSGTTGKTAKLAGDTEAEIVNIIDQW